MAYLLDTNTWVYYLKRPGSEVEARLRATPADQITVCSIIWAELLHGARKCGDRAGRVARIELTLGPYRSFPFDDAAARQYAALRDELETRGELIGANDLFIAAIAMSNSLTLVTNDQSFGRVHGLAVEDWSKPVAGSMP
jgi:tRNA(fMet)-specific endonuclease VapC